MSGATTKGSCNLGSIIGSQNINNNNNNNNNNIGNSLKGTVLGGIDNESSMFGTIHI